MGNKLTKEQIAALLDTPELVTDGTVTLSEEDRAEFEQMRRMRMALSALDDLEPPPNQWDEIEARLAANDQPALASRTIRHRVISWSLQAAAVLALFAAGLFVGQSLGDSDRASAPGTVALEPPAEQEAPPRAISDDPAASYVANVAELVELRDAGWTDRDPNWQRDPASVAERIVHLDELMEASRVALQRVPGDPVLNNFLFDVADERALLASQLDESLRMATLEY